MFDKFTTQIVLDDLLTQPSRTNYGYVHIFAFQQFCDRTCVTESSHNHQRGITASNDHA